MIDRVILIVLDSVGIGALPDAEFYGDAGSNTIGNIAKATQGFRLKHLSQLGLGNISNEIGIEKCEMPIGCFGKAMEVSPGKDTTTGHWEIAGLTLPQAFPTFPKGFPNKLIIDFEKAIGTKTLGNEVASGTEIIARLGDEHVRTGFPIVYTSADSVFQIAAHEDVIPLSRLYEICEIARRMLTGDYAVGRIIARPFAGVSGSYKRTSNRKDYSLIPIGKTLLDIVKENQLNVMAVGKIEDIFARVGITEAVHTKDNMDGIEKTISFMKQDKKGLIFTNLVDFDMLYGHRNDVQGYAAALTAFDEKLPEILENLNQNDVLIITADHGCDPTTASTDHSREYTPILIYGNQVKKGIDIGTRSSFSDIGATILDLLELPIISIAGRSFKNEILNN